MKLRVFVASFLFAFSSSVFSFDWPQNEIMSDSFFAYFGQLRGGRISPSLIFSDTESVKVAEKGRVVAVISEHSDCDLFESTLGNAVVVSHDDGMLSVYANLDDIQDVYEKTDVDSEVSLGVTSNSGWQEGNACLEFQVVDTVNKSFINPRVLMPRTGNELELVLKNVIAINKAGISYPLSTVKTLNAGKYLIYNDRQDVTLPYKTSIFINGALVESFQYSVLYEIDGKLCVKGRDYHSLSEVYPNNNKQLLGEISVPKGHNEILVVISDILGKEYHSTYIFDAK